MAHSNVFQLESVKKSEYEENGIDVLEGYSLQKENFPDSNWVDYWRDSDDDPKDDFKNLVNSLPEGCFEVDEDNLSITLLKPPTGYVSIFFDRLRDETEQLNLSDFAENKCSTWNLERLVMNGGNWFMVYFDEDGYPIWFHDWLLGLAKCGKVGETYYLGGVLDYHY